jgi:hypothetical protein
MHVRKPLRRLVGLTVVCAATATVAAPAYGAYADTATKLNFTQQAQEKSNWCWAAAGNSVAAYLGKSYSQNQFCNMAFNRSINSACPNNQATLANDQTAFQKIGINPGTYVYDYLWYSSVIREIDAKRPILARIQWSSGGGHMEVLYGYDQSNSWVYWGNPWGSSPRYNWATYDYYVSNGSFSWTHSLDRINE